MKNLFSVFSFKKNKLNENSLKWDQLKAYNKSRLKSKKNSFCHAPSINLYFSWEGKVIACCFNQNFILGSYPEQSIDEIWNGNQIKTLRSSLKQNDLSKGCDTCLRDLSNSSFKTSNALRFDEFEVDKFPKMMEFQLSNTCNLECNMCNGWLSSTIRKNREGLPPLPMKYDLEFVNQLEKYIPHLTFTNFSGGEPFLIEIYYDIWEKIIELNPECVIKITTNGTVLNNRVKDLLKKGNFDITVSLDSLDKNTYERIRIGANFERVIDNINNFSFYCGENKTRLNINFCPMVENWKEIPEFLMFCNTNYASIYFSIVHFPWNKSLKSLSSIELNQIIIEIDNEINQLNLSNNSNLKEWERLRLQLKSWILENDSKPIVSNKTIYELRKIVDQKIEEYQLINPTFNKQTIEVPLSKLNTILQNQRIDLNILYIAIYQMSPLDLIMFLNSNEIERKDLFSDYLMNNSKIDSNDY